MAINVIDAFHYRVANTGIVTYLLNAFVIKDGMDFSVPIVRNIQIKINILNTNSDTMDLK